MGVQLRGLLDASARRANRGRLRFPAPAQCTSTGDLVGQDSLHQHSGYHPVHQWCKVRISTEETHCALRDPSLVMRTRLMRNKRST